MLIETNVELPPSNWQYALPATLGRVWLFQVDFDDSVELMQEHYALGPGGTADHRYLVLYMPLGNVLGQFWIDLGLATDFDTDVDGLKHRAPALNQPIAGEHNVAECLSMADDFRKDTFASQLLNEQVNESTLFADYARLLEEDFDRVRNRSSFGRYQMTERNGYSLMGAKEQARKLDERMAARG